MQVGYACITLGVPGTALRGCTMKNARREILLEVTEANLKSLLCSIEYLRQNGIKLFRISSDIIPFGSSPLNTLPWQEVFRDRLLTIGSMIQNSRIRVSMHPGQYTVLNSPEANVAQRAAEDLLYHAAFLDALGLDSSHKIVLHVGGVYGKRGDALRRFLENYMRLDANIKRRLVIENDDKAYNIAEVLELGRLLGIPVVFDALHHKVNPAPGDIPYWINACAATWRAKDGRQKIHYSQQDESKKRGSHSATIQVSQFIDFVRRLPTQETDIMLEVKDKNLSALKCMHCIPPLGTVHQLESEWAKYKYAVLERSQSHYRQIGRMFGERRGSAVEFYQAVENALSLQAAAGERLNASQHIWGYFKDCADHRERNFFAKQAEILKNGEPNTQAMKRFLYKLALKYNRTYLQYSYYFVL